MPRYKTSAVITTANGDEDQEITVETNEPKAILAAQNIEMIVGETGTITRLKVERVDE